MFVMVWRWIMESRVWGHVGDREVTDEKLKTKGWITISTRWKGKRWRFDFLFTNSPIAPDLINQDVYLPEELGLHIWSRSVEPEKDEGTTASSRGPKGFAQHKSRVFSPSHPSCGRDDNHKKTTRGRNHRDR